MVNKKMPSKRYQLASIFLTIAFAAALVPLFSASPAVRAASGTQVYLTPASQSLTSGSNLVVSVMVNTGGASINDVQSSLTYSASSLSLVSIAPGTAFNSFPDSTSSGSIQFSAGTSTPVTGIQTVATMTFHAATAGTSAISFNSSLCGPGNYTLTCTAAYDGATSNNDLSDATTPIVNGSYTVTAAPVTPPSTPSTPSTPAAPKSTTNTSSSSAGKTSSGGSTAKPSTPAASTPSTPAPAAAATPATTTTNPVPIISNVKVSDISATGATVSWQTNLPSSSVVKYGLTTSYGLTAQSSGLSTSHQVKLSAPFIVQGTTYYVEALSATATGASATGGAQQFTARGFTVTISVLDSHGQPIKGAVVTDGGISATTNSSGVATLQNVPAGAQSLTIKSGSSITKRNITVGKLDPKTGTYVQQKFSLTATRGHNNNVLPYALIVIVALLAAGAVLFASPASARRLLDKLGKGKGGPGNPGSSGDIDLKPMAATTIAPDSPTVEPESPPEPEEPKLEPKVEPPVAPEPEPEPELEPEPKPKAKPKPEPDSDDGSSTAKPNHTVVPNDDSPAPGTIIPPDEDQI